MLLNNQGGAVDATPKLFYLVSGQVVTGHKLLVSVTVAAGRRDIARRYSAYWLLRRQNAVRGTAVRAHGGPGVSTRQKLAVLRGLVLCILIGGEAVWFHAGGVRVARGTELDYIHPGWLAYVSLLNRMRLQMLITVVYSPIVTIENSPL